MWSPQPAQVTRPQVEQRTGMHMPPLCGQFSPRPPGQVRRVTEPLHLADRAHEEAEEYRHGHDRPLGGYLGLLGAYGAAVGIGAAAVRRQGPLPERPSLVDLGLVALATFRTSRVLTKDSITSPLRAPFTRYEGAAGNAELHEGVRGTGARKALGELVTCPFCLSQWIGTSLTFGMRLAPRATRQVAGAMSAMAVSDLMQFVRARLET